MSFFETPLRRLRLVRACGAFVLAIGIGCLPLLVEVDQRRRIFWLALVAGCVGAGFVYLWLAWRTRQGELLIAWQFGSKAEEIRYFRKALWVGAIAFPLLSFVTAYKLQRLESGAADRVRIWTPVALIYEHFGYWPTMISLPLIGICCCAALIRKLRNLNTPRPGIKTGSDLFSNR